MCFSAEASFSAGAVLGIIGTVSLGKVTRPSQFMFASIPMLFAIQQVCEGILWLSFSHPGLISWQINTTYVFLVFAQILWPLWVPLSILLIETNQLRKKILLAICGCGVLVALISICRFIFYPVSSEIIQHHIYYHVDAPKVFTTVSSVFYLIATILPAFVSAVPRIKLVAVLLLGSLIATKLFYEFYLVSVWCFFAAILSIAVIYVMGIIQRPVFRAIHSHQFKGE